MALGGTRRRGNIGISISSSRVVAWVESGAGSVAGSEWSQDIAPMPPTASEWPELEVALRALAAESGGGSLFIALRPPLAQVRAVQLPPVDPEDAARLVARSAGKYFVGAREPQVVGVNAEEEPRDNVTHALACAASARVIDAIREAAEGAGWKVARVVPAQSAWVAAADHVWAKSDALVDHGRIVVLDDERTEVIFKRNGHPESFRHLRELQDDSSRLLDILTPATHSAAAPGVRTLRPVAIIGSDAARRSVAPALRERGLQPLEPEGFWSKVMSSAALSAAHFAPLTEDLELVSEQVRNRRVERMHKLAVYLGIAAAVLFIAGMSVRHIALRQELAELQSRRAEIREAVGQVREAQRRIGTMAAPAAALDSVQRNAARWSLVLSDIALQLPTDSYVTQIRMANDSINLMGQGRDAGTTIQSLRQAEALRDVRQSGQIRRDGDVSYFSLTGAVRKEVSEEGRQ